jgi:hypothetical protein
MAGADEMSMTGRQKRRIQRTRESARRLRELENHHRYLLPAQARQPEYWRDLSVEIAGTIVAAFVIFTSGHLLGYIERPAGRSEMLRLLGLLAIVLVVVFAIVRVRRVRADHPGASSARLAGLYVRAIAPHWSIPALVFGVGLGLGFF